MHAIWEMLVHVTQPGSHSRVLWYILEPLPLNQWAVAAATSTRLLVPRVPSIQKDYISHLSGCCDQMIRGNLKEEPIPLTYHRSKGSSPSWWINHGNRSMEWPHSFHKQEVEGPVTNHSLPWTRFHFLKPPQPCQTVTQLGTKYTNSWVGDTSHADHHGDFNPLCVLSFQILIGSLRYLFVCAESLIDFNLFKGKLWCNAQFGIRIEPMQSLKVYCGMNYQLGW